MNATQTTTPTVESRSFAEMPGSNTYFRTSDCTPFFYAGSLIIYNGKGDSRSWGTPSVRSTVQALTATVVMVTVTGWHKHTVNPVGGKFYFVNEGGEWVRRTANHKSVKAALAAKSH